MVCGYELPIHAFSSRSVAQILVCSKYSIGRVIIDRVGQCIMNDSSINRYIVDFGAYHCLVMLDC